jgi:hypothetical protein
VEKVFEVPKRLTSLEATAAAAAELQEAAIRTAIGVKQLRFYEAADARKIECEHEGIDYDGWNRRQIKRAARGWYHAARLRVRRNPEQVALRMGQKQIEPGGDSRENGINRSGNLTTKRNWNGLREALEIDHARIETRDAQAFKLNYSLRKKRGGDRGNTKRTKRKLAKYESIVISQASMPRSTSSSSVSNLATGITKLIVQPQRVDCDGAGSTVGETSCPGDDSSMQEQRTAFKKTRRGGNQKDKKKAKLVVENLDRERWYKEKRADTAIAAAAKLNVTTELATSDVSTPPKPITKQQQHHRDWEAASERNHALRASGEDPGDAHSEDSFDDDYAAKQGISTAAYSNATLGTVEEHSDVSSDLFDGSEQDGPSDSDVEIVDVDVKCGNCDDGVATGAQNFKDAANFISQLASDPTKMELFEDMCCEELFNLSEDEEPQAKTY